MMKQLHDFPGDVVAVVGAGHVTRADYDTVLIPAVERALKAHDRVRLYYEISQDFAMTPGAIWEDFKVGMERLTRWERIAVVTDVDWIKQTVRLFSFLIPGMVKTFATSEAREARAWIAEK